MRIWKRQRVSEGSAMSLLDSILDGDECDCFHIPGRYSKDGLTDKFSIPPRKVGSSQIDYFNNLASNSKQSLLLSWYTARQRQDYILDLG